MIFQPGLGSGGPGLQKPAGLYIHVPFCRARCNYCDFYSAASPGGVPDLFVETLRAEVRLYGEEPPIALDTVYVGGGTPSLLTPEQVFRLRDGLDGPFDLSGLREATFEANPESLDGDRLLAWRAAGFNRISIGVQSFQERETKALSRLSGPSACKSAVLSAERAGFSNISIDIMGGIPGQTTAAVTETLRLAASLPISHLSFYILEVHPGTGLYSDVVSGRTAIPGEEELAELYALAREIMLGSGFEHYEISNFARGGPKCLHNLKYWQGGEYIGLGPSAHGRFRGYMTSNPPSLEDWASEVLAGRLATGESRRMTREMEAENEVIFGLRLAEGIPISALEKLKEALGVPLQEKVRRLVEGGHAEVDGGRFRLTPEGFLVSSEVVAYLLPEGWRS